MIDCVVCDASILGSKLSGNQLGGFSGGKKQTEGQTKAVKEQPDHVLIDHTFGATIGLDAIQ